jgi:hypothetical protein
MVTGVQTCALPISVQLRVGKYRIGTVVLIMAVQPTVVLSMAVQLTQQLTLGNASEFL